MAYIELIKKDGTIYDIHDTRVYSHSLSTPHQIAIKNSNNEYRYIRFTINDENDDVADTWCASCDYVIAQLGLSLPTPTTIPTLNSNLTAIVNAIASQNKTLAAQGILGFVMTGSYFSNYFYASESEFYSILLQGTYDQMAIITTNGITYLSEVIANHLSTTDNTISLS